MKIFDLNELSSGMVLAEPVYDFHGILLLSKGSKLTCNNIRILKTWGISEVVIEGVCEEKQQRDMEPALQFIEDIEKKLREKFSEVIHDSIMEEIMRVAGKHLIKRSVSKTE